MLLDRASRLGPHGRRPDETRLDSRLEDETERSELVVVRNDDLMGGHDFRAARKEAGGEIDQLFYDTRATHEHAHAHAHAQTVGADGEGTGMSSFQSAAG